MCLMGDSFISLYGHLLSEDRTKFIEGVLLEMIDIAGNETSRKKLDVSIQREIGSILLDYERVGFKSLAMGAAELLEVQSRSPFLWPWHSQEGRSCLPAAAGE